MTWQITSFVLLALALGSGMLWYERSHPPSRTVALVAVLAALAVAGRIVLAPIPNVVATTDIVLIAGYVLGPAAGFAVGTISGLVSNFWLGQGAWTPWQMLGWGMAGITGAALWKLTSGKAGRFTLAAVCGLVGLAFGALMNLQTMVSYGGDMSLARYLALEARAIPFDLAHMTGNIIFALVAGPAMIGALTRFRERFEWRRAADKAGVSLILLAVAVAVFGFSGIQPQPADAAYPKEMRRAAGWLRAQQNADGGFPLSPGDPSRLTSTTRSMLALAAAGVNPLDVKKNGKTPYDYLLTQRKDLSEPGDIALTVLSLKTIKKDPRKFAGRNLVKALREKSTGDGWFRVPGSRRAAVNITAWAAIAFRSAGASGDERKTTGWLREIINPDGGWGISVDSPSEPDSTGAALMAVRGGKAIRRSATRFLKGEQTKSGGFGNAGGAVNSQSTSVVGLGLIAMGRGTRYLKRNGNTAADYLLARQQKDGSIRYSGVSDQTPVWVTADTIPALAGKTLPIGAPPRAPKAKPKPETNPGESGTTYTPGPGSISPSTPSTPSTSSGPSAPSSPGSAGSGSSKTTPGSSPSGTSTSPSPGTAAPVVPPVIPVVPSEALLAASAPGPSPSPVLAILIGLVVSGGLCGGTILLVRRLRW